MATSIVARPTGLLFGERMQLRENKVLLVRLGAALGAATFFLSAIVVGIIDRDQMLVAMRYVGLAVLAGTASLFALDWLTNKWTAFRNLLGVPDFGGRWEGWYYPSYTQKWTPICFEIKQKGLNVTLATFAEHNSSKSVAAAIIVDENGSKPELIATYQSQSLSDGHVPGAQHTGTFLLQLRKQASRKLLVGRYFTDRQKADGTRGTQAFITVAHVGNALAHGLIYKKRKWPLPRPRNKPLHTQNRRAINR